MKTFKIVLNRKYANTESTVNSTMLNYDNYYVNQEATGQTLTNSMNVRSFINDQKNINLSNGFIKYLNENFSDNEINEIISNDQKLSENFNLYYNNMFEISTSQLTSIGNNNITRTDINEIEYYYDYESSNIVDGFLENSKLQKNIIKNINIESTEENYYIPIEIKKDEKQISKYEFDPCFVITDESYRQYIKCFVDLVVKTDEKNDWY